MSFMNESILVGFADLSRPRQLFAHDAYDKEKTHSSTMQLFVLMSNTFPPN